MTFFEPMPPVEQFSEFYKPLLQLFSNEFNRYKSKGLGCLVSIAMVTFFFVYMPELGHIVFPHLLKLQEEYNVSTWMLLLIIGYLQTFVVLAISYIVMYWVYYINHPFFEQYKGLDQKWPWDEDREKWLDMVWRCLGNFMFNNLVIRPALDAFELYKSDFQIEDAMSIEELPNSKTLLYTVLYCLLIEEVIAYSVHAWSHHKYLYPYIHKKHHKPKQVVSIVSQYENAAENIMLRYIGGVGPSLVPGGMHVWTSMVFSLIKLLEVVDAHSGYEFPWSPFRMVPFATSS